eukprot:TRINITY_DN30315_c0_g2_i1.p1 TRINITY_DN30315_c0_g2~~TRINITY_DN30315_c0_g2_i1.p1  ORF type:complete len:661 (-),score=92.19 TRINITY_DN30315_c0_g2_i1:65-2005(-)
MSEAATGDQDTRQLSGFRAGFVGKVIDAKPAGQDRDTSLTGDPLNIHGEKEASTAAAEARAASKPRRRQKKTKQESIFADFGKEYDPFREVDIGGVIVKKFNHSRFWQNDHDLSRWRKDLHHESLGEKLCYAARARANQEFEHDNSMLRQTNGALARQRCNSNADRAARPSSMSPVQQLKDLQAQLNPKEKKSKKKAAKELFESFNFLGLGKKEEPGSENNAETRSKHEEDQEERPLLSDTEELIYGFLDFLLSKFGSLEDSFVQIDINKNGMLALSEFTQRLQTLGYKKDPKDIWRRLDKAKKGSVTHADFMDLKPYVMQGILNNYIQAPPNFNLHQAQSTSSRQQASVASTPPQGTPRSKQSKDQGSVAGDLNIPRSDDDGISISAADASGERRSQVDGKESADLHEADLHQHVLDREALALSQSRSKYERVVGPPTLTLLLFKNSDQYHYGATAFWKRRPLTMADLLAVAGEVCRPLIPPAEALLDMDLRRVRSLDEIDPSVPYLVKGKETLDPPPAFFQVSFAQRPSLRNFQAVRRACQAEGESRHCLPSPPKSCGGSMFTSKASSMSSLTSCRAGSPPYHTALNRNPQRAGDKWEPHASLSACLSWGGLGQLAQHHSFEKFRPVPLQSERAIDRRIMAATF